MLTGTLSSLGFLLVPHFYRKRSKLEEGCFRFLLTHDEME